MSGLWLGIGTLTLLAVMLVVVPLLRTSGAPEGWRRWPMPALLLVLLLGAAYGYSITGHWRDIAAEALLGSSQPHLRPAEDRRIIIRYLSRSLRQQPNNAMIAIQLGLELQANGNLQQALTLFKIALHNQEAMQALGIEQDITRLVEGLERIKSEALQPKLHPPNDS